MRWPVSGRFNARHQAAGVVAVAAADAQAAAAGHTACNGQAQTAATCAGAGTRKKWSNTRSMSSEWDVRDHCR